MLAVTLVQLGSHDVTSLSQAVTKCGTVGPPVRGTTYFARHKMVNVNNTIFFFFLRERPVPLFELEKYIYKANVHLYGAYDVL